jgi:hypothetical protein
MPPRFAVALVVVTAVLSAGQAWAMGARRAGWVRYPIVWAVATAVLVQAARWAFEWRAQDVRGGPVASTLGVIAALTTALALGIAAWLAGRDRDDPLTSVPWHERVLSLAGVHGVVLFVAGGVGLVILVLVMVGQIH